jgi:hypothetical protein
LAKGENALILAETTSRLVRSHLYHPSDRPDAQPKDAEFQVLLEYVEGVRLVTALNPDAIPGEERAYQTIRGQQAKGNRGGRPRKINSERGKLKERRLRYRSLTAELAQRGMKCRQIAAYLNAIPDGLPAVSFKPVWNWLRADRNVV